MDEATPDITDAAGPLPGAVVPPQEEVAPVAPASIDLATPDDAGSIAADTVEAPEPSAAPPRRTRELPAYTRSLLKITVPVMVTLAEKKQSLDQIVELSPGAIIQFDKSCEEMLDLSVAGRKVAAGEAVKVGDKFGLKITSVVLPEERFETARPRPKS